MSILPPEYLRILNVAPCPPGLTSSLQSNSSSYDHPQVTICQQYVWQVERQREHDVQQLHWQEKDRLKQLEEQRKREEYLANKALQEVEKAKKKQMEHQGVYKPKMRHFMEEASAEVENEDKNYSTSSNSLIQTTEEVLRQDSHEMMKRPTITEVLDEVGNNLLPYEPNFKCQKCGKSYPINEKQRFKRHIEFCLKRNDLL